MLGLLEKVELREIRQLKESKNALNSKTSISSSSFLPFVAIFSASLLQFSSPLRLCLGKGHDLG